MYDPAETEISFVYLQKIQQLSQRIDWALLGGWAVFLYVNQEYRRAFGEDYLRSRDIDLFLPARQEKEFSAVIKKLGFEESSYYFRYELIYEREEKRILAKEEARPKPLFRLIYIFLDIFSEGKTTGLGTWTMKELERAETRVLSGLPVVDLKTLLHLKAAAFFAREKLDKELKDACDLYALLFYASEKVPLALEVRKAMEKILSRPELQEFIAANVLKDALKASLVAANLYQLLKGNSRKTAKKTLG